MKRKRTFKVWVTKGLRPRPGTFAFVYFDDKSQEGLVEAILTISPPRKQERKGR